MNCFNRSRTALCIAAFALSGCGATQITSVPTATTVSSVAHTTQRVSPDGIVYTPVNVQIENSQYGLDLNNDSTPDFNIADVTNKQKFECDGHPEYNENGALSLESVSNFNGYEMHGDYVARLRKGSPIGPSQSFRTETGFTGMEHMSITWQPPCEGPPPPVVYEGNWHPGRSGYLGLAFEIGGTTHYGWAAVTPDGFSGATLTGYAYQTIADKSINAGQK